LEVIHPWEYTLVCQHPSPRWKLPQGAIEPGLEVDENFGCVQFEEKE